MVVDRVSNIVHNEPIKIVRVHQLDMDDTIQELSSMIHKTPIVYQDVFYDYKGRLVTDTSNLVGYA